MMKPHFVPQTRDKKLDANVSVEKQFSPSELGRIHSAIHFTHAVIGNKAEDELNDIMKNGMDTGRRIFTRKP